MGKNSIFTITVIGIGLLLWLILNTSSMFLFWGIMCGLMFFNVTLSTMSNVLTGSMVNGSDTVWRLILIFLSSVFLVIGIFLH